MPVPPFPPHTRKKLTGRSPGAWWREPWTGRRRPWSGFGGGEGMEFWGGEGKRSDVYRDIGLAPAFRLFLSVLSLSRLSSPPPPTTTHPTMTVGGYKDVSGSALTGGEDAADIKAAAEAAVAEVRGERARTLVRAFFNLASPSHAHTPSPSNTPHSSPSGRAPPSPCTPSPPPPSRSSPA